MADEQSPADQVNDTSPERDYELDARKTGWRPQAEYKGDPAKWIEAKSWVERGESFIPFLQASNRELRAQIESRDSKLEDMNRQLHAATKAIEDLKDVTVEQAVETLESQKAGLIEEIAKAHEEGDIRTELKLRDQFSEIGDQIRAKKSGIDSSAVSQREAGSGETRPAPRSPAEDPVFQSWLSENQWFREDPMMAGAAISLLNHLNADASFKNLQPRERLDRVAAEVQKRFGSASRKQHTSKVEGSRSDNSGSSSRTKTYNDLPDDAKVMCDKMSAKFVGKVNGRGEVKFKTVDDYRSQYVRDYFDDSWGARHLAS